MFVAQLSLAKQPGPDLVSLAWNPSPDSRTTGYFLCWGLARDACTNLLDAGSSTNATVAGMFTHITYYFSVVAYGDGCPNSPPSNVIACSLPSAASTLVAQLSLANQPGPDVVSLAWNPSPDPRATGYFLCWGLARDACTNLLDVGSSTNVTVAGLVPQVTYYFSVVTYGDGCPNSPPSNVIACSLPAAAITPLEPKVSLTADSSGQALMPDLTHTKYTLAADTCSQPVAVMRSVAAGTELAPGATQAAALTVGCGNTANVAYDTRIDNSAPVIQTLTQRGGLLTLTWPAIVGQMFQVQFKSDLGQTDWSNLSSAIPATNATMQAFDAVGPNARRYYRLVRLP